MTLPIPLTALSSEDEYTDFLTSIEAEHGKEIEKVTLKRTKGNSRSKNKI